MNQSREAVNMPEKDPTTWQFLAAGIMGLWGAVVSIVDKVKSGKIKQINAITFLGEITASLFSTYTVFFLCVGMEFNIYYTVGVAGLAGHYGPRTLFIIQKWWVSR